MNQPVKKITGLKAKLLANYRQGILFGAWGAGGGALGSLISESLNAISSSEHSWWNSAIQVGLWFGEIGASISIALTSAHFWYLKRGLQIPKSIWRGILPGAISGFIAGAIAQIAYTTIEPTEFLRTICWGLAGALLGFGLSFRIPNLGRWRGATGGGIGGVIGGCLFILCSMLLGSEIGRFIGITAIGFCLGLAIVLVEGMFRSAWLVVHWSTNEQKILSLGKTPITLGSTESTDIYLPRSQFPAQVAKIFMEGSDIIIEFDPMMGEEKKMRNLRHKLSDGDRRKFSNITIEAKQE